MISEYGAMLQNHTQIISNEDLVSGYHQDQFSEELLPTDSPFTIKLIPRKETAFSFKNGVANPISYRLLPDVEKTLEKFKGNRRKTAKALNISERTLYRKINEYCLQKKYNNNDRL